MKKPATPIPSGTPGKPADPQHGPEHAQLEPTPGRDQVREAAYPVHAPRQTKRPVERTGKGRSGA